MAVPNTRRGQRQNSVSTTVPAPILGINATQSLPLMNPAECIYAYNMLAEDLGVTVRDGYVEWANGWTGSIARTVITFEGNESSEDRLFVANEEGIWDVTTEGETAPTKVVSFPSAADNAGICSYVNFTNDGNERFLLLCDGENGYYRWTQSTDTWVKYSLGGGANQIAGIDPALFDFVMVWKKRVWFVESGSANAWYLPVSVFEGTAVQFNFGDQFRFGGTLRSLHNWTLDGGDGMDDHLVIISGAGDVVIYQGTDPAAVSTFGLIGSWYVGQVPSGNRIASEFSGELYILSVQGLMPLSGVLNGPNMADDKTYMTFKVSPYIRVVMDEVLNEFGWHVHIHPKSSLLYVNSPPRFALEQLAFTLYFGNRSWSMTRGLEKSHSANWQGDVFWTDITQNKVYIQRGNVDKVYLDPATDGDPEAITWDLLTAYQPFEEPARFKRCQYIRPMFIAGGVPSYEVRAQYDFDISELAGTPVFASAGSAVWNTGVWDTDVFAGGLEASDTPRGASGMGRHIAINLRGRSSEPTTLAAFDIIYDQGGLM